MPRLEDFRLITGQGRYTDDLSFPDQLCGYFVRVAPCARADRSPSTPKPLRRCRAWLPCSRRRISVASGARGVNQIANPAGRGGLQDQGVWPGWQRWCSERPQLPPFARDKARFVGEPVAMVVAKSVAQARDACEAISVDYDVLPVVIDAAEALKPGAPLVFDEVPNNCAVDYARGRQGEAR